MSDPVTNVDVEDVLSSIRRLVSEEPVQRRALEAKKTDRFVLTPALRVAVDHDEQAQQGDEAAAEAEEAPAPLSDADAPQDDADDQPSEQAEAAAQTPAETTANDDAEEPAVDDQVGDAGEDFLTEPAAVETAEAAVDGRADASQSDKDHNDRDQHNQDDAHGHGDDTDALMNQPQQDAGAEQAAFHGEATLENRIVGLETAIGQVQEEWEPDGSEPDADARPTRHIFQSSRAETESANQPSQDPHSTAEAAQATPDRTFEQELYETIAAEENETVLQAGDATLDAGGKMSEAAASPDVPTEAEDLRALDVEASNGGAPDTAAAMHIPLSDDQILDEDFLRDIVSEIVRRELQGDLGERITRNVRRMVRREIQRALALKEFD